MIIIIIKIILVDVQLVLKKIFQANLRCLISKCRRIFHIILYKHIMKLNQEIFWTLKEVLDFFYKVVDREMIYFKIAVIRDLMAL